MKSLDLFLSQVFLSLESFLQKATTLNMFETLIFNYKVKVNNVEQCTPKIFSFVVELCNELQVILKENTIIDGADKIDASGRSSITSPSHSTLNFCDLQRAEAQYEQMSDSMQSNRESESKEEWVTNIMTSHNKIGTAEEESERKLPEKDEQNIFSCNFCKRKYRSNGRLLKHINICKSARVIPPPDERDEELVDEPDSETSQTAQLGPESGGGVELPVYMCAGCLSTYSSKYLFDQHTHADDNQQVELVTDLERLQTERKFSCGSCQEVYRSLGRISYHVVRCRLGPYQCELCPHVAVSRQLLNRHKKRHHRGVECFFCSECGLGFKLRTSLQKHLVNRHESHCDHFVCDMETCSETFTKKIHLTNHKLEVHGVERRFLCQVCGHKFMTPESLSCHLEFHNNRTKFECRFCSKTFKTKEKMILHVRTHTGEKPFVCDRATCRKSFVSKSKLMEHLKRHNGEKRHKCLACGKQYANKQDLRLHLRKIHQIQQNEETTNRAKSPLTCEVQTTGELPLAEVQTAEPSTGLDLYPSQVILQMDNAGSQLYSNMQFYQEPGVQLVVASYDTIIGM